MHKLTLITAAAATLGTASPALAQNVDYSGFYVGGQIGKTFNTDSSRETVLFDNNLDGSFGDNVFTAAGANAFSPGFCGGTASTAMAAGGCNDDDGNKYEWGIHAGLDHDFGGPVVGIVAEYSRPGIEDAVTAFSTTPANYVLSRELRNTMALRIRMGGQVAGFLPYVTTGIVRAKVRSGFSTSNTANQFSTSGSSDNALGFQVGGGVERKFGAFAIGARYLYTNVDDDDFRVNVTRGTAPATNPFVRVNENGTQFRRSDDQLDYHAVALTGSFRF